MTFSEACVNAEADAVGNALDNGYLRLYSGVPPASADAAVRGRLLAELRLGVDAFPPARAGKLSAAPIRDTFAVGTGIASWGRVLDANGTPYFDGVVGRHIELDQIALSDGGSVRCRSLTLKVSKG